MKNESLFVRKFAAFTCASCAFWMLFATGPLRGQEEPLAFSPQDRILVLSPHPDDDILGCAGVIQKAVEQHLPLRVVYLTYGDNYEWAFMDYEKRPVLTPRGMQQMGLMRREEAIAGEAVLGVPADELTFLGYPDWGTEAIFMNYWREDRPAFRSMLTKVRAVPYANALHPGAPYIGESVLADLEKVMEDFKPTKVFVTHPAEGHRDHRALYLFTQVALWDLESQMHPTLYPYLIHYPHWPLPRGLHPDRTLEPPSSLHGLVWTINRLTAPETDQKAQALRAHRTQMGKDHAYLYSFVGENELFAGFPDIELGPPNASPPGLKTSQPKNLPTLSETASVTDIAWHYVYKEGDDLVFRMEFAPHFHWAHPVNIYAFGYRHDRPFARMPKLHLVILGHRLSVLDQGQVIEDPAIRMDREGRTLLIHLPLRSLGDPEKLLGTAWSRSAEEPFDWRVWRILDLGNSSGVR